jgi:hypothetical protein
MVPEEIACLDESADVSRLGRRIIAHPSLVNFSAEPSLFESPVLALPQQFPESCDELHTVLKILSLSEHPKPAM